MTVEELRKIIREERRSAKHIARIGEDRDAVKNILWQFVDMDTIVSKIANEAVATVGGAKNPRKARRMLATMLSKYGMDEDAANAIVDVMGL